jgi:hypothetical protein
MAVQRARHQLLSGSRLARDQHRRARLRKTSDAAKDFLHGGRLAKNLGRDLGRLDDLGLAPAFVQGPADELDGLVDVERLGQVLVGTALERGHRRIEVRVRRHHDDRHGRIALLHGSEQLQP